MTTPKRFILITVLLVTSILFNFFLWIAYGMEAEKNNALVGVINKQAESYNKQLELGVEVGKMADACLSKDESFDYVAKYARLKEVADERNKLFAEYESLKNGIK